MGTQARKNKDMSCRFIVAALLGISAANACDDSGVEDVKWSDPEVSAAIGVSIGAGLATGVGGAAVFFPQLMQRVPQSVVLATSLAVSAGVMLYVSFIEIFAKSYDAISCVSGVSEGGAAAITTACFFAGMGLCVLLEILVYYLSKKAETGNPNACPGDIHPHGVPELATADFVGSAHSSGQNGCGDSTQQQEQVLELGQVKSEIVDSSSKVHSSTQDLDAASKKQLLRMGALTATAIAVHNFPEGLATFLATVSDTKVGVSLGVAIAVPNIPEGLCVAMPIYYSTGNKWKAFDWSLLSGVTEPIGGLLGFAVLQPVFTDLVFGIIFSMVGGMMVFIVCHELLPAAHKYMGNTNVTTSWFVLGMIVMATSLVLFVQ